MKLFLSVFITLCFFNSSIAQQVSLKGKIIDSETNEPLFFANIRILNTSAGTTSNKNGEFELKLKPGTYALAASFIGYNSDTLQLEVNKFITSVTIKLTPTGIIYPEVIIKPGENPAIAIIRKAIERKNEIKNKVENYVFEAYTKGLIKTNQDIIVGNNSIGTGIGGADSSDLKITGILENQSKGYYKKPGSYKEVIIARKQSANLPSSINVLTGGRLVQNFYEEEVSFFGRPLPGPLADNALNYYYFYIGGKTSLNNKLVYRINITPDNSTDPGLTGQIFINDSTYDLVRVELMLNRAANQGGLLDSISIFQQFVEYNNNIYMPSNYRLAVTANLLGLAKFGFEITTILYDYNINKGVDQDIFDKALITVVPDADEKDTTYWAGQQVIPNTEEEQTAYKRIDSLQAVPLTFWDRFSILSDRIPLSDNFSVSAPLGLYHFNRVEGNSLDFGVFANDGKKERLNTDIQVSYGFSDKKVKKRFSLEYLLGNYRTTEVSISAFDKLSVLFENSDDYNDFTSTMLALLTKYEFRDYYYSRGFDVNLSGEVFPILILNAGFLNRTDRSAIQNSNFSIFAKSRSYDINPPINDVRINAIKAGFEIDFRNYIEDGLFRRRITQNGTFIILSGDVTLSDKKIASELNFTKYEGNITGGLRTFRSASLEFRIKGIYNNGTMPQQLLYAVPGNINLAAKRFSFRTLNVNEVIGENIFTVNIEHSFRDELFKMFRIPFLKDSELQLYTYLNAALSDVGSKTEAFIPRTAGSLLHPYYEAGFGIGHFLFPIQLEFSWRLNYREGNKDGNNFRIGLNSFVF